MLDEQAQLNKSRKEGRNKFTKFLLKSWQPIPTWQSTIILFLIVGLALIGFGVALYVINSNIVEVSAEYDVVCTDANGALKSPCQVSIDIPAYMTQPVFIYYELDNFYQNHRRYINSMSAAQLSGNEISLDKAEGDCNPLATNDQMGVKKSISNPQVDLDPNAVAIPCGLIAKSLFTDTFEVYSGTTVNPTNKVPIDEKGIAWPSDVGTKFKNTDLTKQWIDLTNEHLIVWMRTAGLPDFRKLWGRITQDLAPGPYVVNIVNTYPVASFNGAKRVVLSTTGPFGGKNDFLTISYLVVGGVCVLISFFFLIRWRQFARKKN